MATTIAIAGVLATVASTTYGVYSSEQAKGDAKDQAKKLAEQQAAQAPQLGKMLLPGEKANQAARVGGGISPDFMAADLGSLTGIPNMNQQTDLLSQIQQSLGGGGSTGTGIQAP